MTFFTWAECKSVQRQLFNSSCGCSKKRERKKKTDHWQGARKSEKLTALRRPTRCSATRRRGSTTYEGCPTRSRLQAQRVDRQSTRVWWHINVHSALVLCRLWLPAQQYRQALAAPSVTVWKFGGSFRYPARASSLPLFFLCLADILGPSRRRNLCSLWTCTKFVRVNRPSPLLLRLSSGVSGNRTQAQRWTAHSVKQLVLRPCQRPSGGNCARKYGWCLFRVCALQCLLCYSDCVQFTCFSSTWIVPRNWCKPKDGKGTSTPKRMAARCYTMISMKLGQ